MNTLQTDIVKNLFYSFLFLIFISCSSEPKYLEIIPPKNDSANKVIANEIAKTVQEDREQKQTNSVTGIEFAFCNEAGTQLLALADSITSPSSFSKSVSGFGTLIDVSFKKKRSPDKEDNNRKTHYNFEKSGGYLFETKSEKVNKDSSCILLSEEFLKERKFLRLISNYNTVIPGPVRSKIEQNKSRKIKKFKCLGQIDKGLTFYIIEFERVKDSCFASLIYVSKDKFLSLDFPGKYDEVSVWRVDDGGEFGVEYYNLLAAFEHNGKLEIVTDWIGAEGYSIELLIEKGNEFKAVKGAYRYTAPL